MHTFSCEEPIVCPHSDEVTPTFLFNNLKTAITIPIFLSFYSLWTQKRRQFNESIFIFISFTEHTSLRASVKLSSVLPQWLQLLNNFGKKRSIIGILRVQRLTSAPFDKIRYQLKTGDSIVGEKEKDKESFRLDTIDRLRSIEENVRKINISTRKPIVFLR